MPNIPRILHTGSYVCMRTPHRNMTHQLWRVEKYRLCFESRKLIMLRMVQQASPFFWGIRNAVTTDKNTAIPDFQHIVTLLLLSKSSLVAQMHYLNNQNN